MADLALVALHTHVAVALHCVWILDRNQLLALKANQLSLTHDIHEMPVDRLMKIYREFGPLAWEFRWRLQLALIG
jgi:hypothetical protein